MLTVPFPGDTRGEAGDVSMTILPAASEETVAALPAPKSTAVAESRFVPVIVTLVPPVGSPDVGETEVIVGTPAGGGGRHPDDGQRHPRGAQKQGHPQGCLREPD